MQINNSQQLAFGTEMTATMTGIPVVIGVMPVSPAKIIFDNQSDFAVSIFINISTGTPWRTFPAGEAIVIDLNEMDAKGPIPIGTIFFGVGASGTFSISYLYYIT